MRDKSNPHFHLSMHSMNLMAVFIAAYGFGIFVFLCVMAVFAVRKKGIVQGSIKIFS